MGIAGLLYSGWFQFFFFHFPFELEAQDGDAQAGPRLLGVRQLPVPVLQVLN